MKSKQNTNEKGFVLVVVLGMVMLLAVLLLGFSSKARKNLTAVDEFTKSEQALNYARAGLNIAIAALRDNPEIQSNDKLKDLLSGENDFSIGDGSCSINITSENAKLNVNMLIGKNGKPNRTRIDQMLRLIDLLKQNQSEHPGFGYGLVPAIIDWIDKDNNVTYLPFIKYENSGAESEFYSQLDNPYKCKNAPLDSTRELLLVKGIFPDLFESLRDHVTVYGDGTININDASATVLQSLSEDIDPLLAKMITERQKLGPLEDITDLQHVPGMTSDIYSKIIKQLTASSRGKYYQVESSGKVDQAARMVKAIIARDSDTKKVEVLLYEEI